MEPSVELDVLDERARPESAGRRLLVELAHATIGAASLEPGALSQARFELGAPRRQRPGRLAVSFREVQRAVDRPELLLLASRLPVYGSTFGRQPQRVAAKPLRPGEDVGRPAAAGRDRQTEPRQLDAERRGRGSQLGRAERRAERLRGGRGRSGAGAGPAAAIAVHAVQCVDVAQLDPVDDRPPSFERSRCLELTLGGIRSRPLTAAARATVRCPRSASSTRPSSASFCVACEPARRLARVTEPCRAAAATPTSVASALNVGCPRAANARRAAAAIAAAVSVSPAARASRAASRRSLLRESTASAARERSSNRARSARASGSSLSATRASARQR